MRLVDKLWDEAVAQVCAPATTCDPRYRTLGPVIWAHERLGVPLHTLMWSLAGPEYAGHVWDGTPDPFVAASVAVAQGRDVGIESATGTGKTFWLALLTLWFLDAWANSLVVTAAPKEAQLTLHMWKEISALWPRFQQLHPLAELTHLRILMRPGNKKWAAHGFACGVGADEESATKAQGFHQADMLLICEETPGMHPAITTAFDNTSTGDHNLNVRVGNPDSVNDELHRFCERPSTVPIRISALDHPNVVTGREVIPGAVGRKKVQEREVNYGVDSRLYQSRVRGLCPTEGAESLLRWSWLQASARVWQAATEEDRRRRDELAQGVVALGVDVANSENGDKACVVRGEGAVVREVTARPCPDANELGRLVVAPLMETYGILPKHVGVDAVGVGAGTVNELKRLGLRVRALHGGAAAVPLSKREEQCANLRSQMYWQLRLDLEKGHIAIPPDRELLEELVTPQYTTKTGKIKVESKDDIKKRLGGRSPDKADALAYWNWVRVTRGAASSGGATVDL